MEHNTASTCANHFYVTGPQVMNIKDDRVKHYERNEQSGRADSSSSHSSSEMEHNTVSTCSNHFYVSGPQVMKMVTPGHSKPKGAEQPPATYPQRQVPSPV